MIRPAVTPPRPTYGHPSSGGLQRISLRAIERERMRDGAPDVAETLARQGRNQTVRDSLRVKEVRVGEGDGAQRFIICHNPAEAERQQAIREQTITRLQAELDRIEGSAREGQDRQAPDQDQHRGAPQGRVRAARSPVAGTLPAPNAGRPAAHRPARRSRGGPPGRQVPTVQQRSRPLRGGRRAWTRTYWRPSAGFRDLKGVLRLRPMFHRLEHRIRAHVLIDEPSRSRPSHA